MLKIKPAAPVVTSSTSTLRLAREAVRVLRVRSGIRTGDSGSSNGTGSGPTTAQAIVAVVPALGH